MNIISIVGPSRGGKSALTPYFSACEEVDLPFNTPDLDWIIDSHNYSHMTDEGFKHHLSIYMFTYAWYSFLGRHINLRNTDYYSAGNLKPYLDIDRRFSKPDNDESFQEFLAKVSEKSWIPCFQLDISPKQYQIVMESTDIKYMPVFSRRSPYDLLRAWLVGNRLDRSKDLSRMMKYGSIPKKSNLSFANQFVHNLSKQDSSIDKTGNFTFHSYEFSDLDKNINNINSLIDLVIFQEDNATFWESYGCAIPFEEMVSNPEKVQGTLERKLGIKFNPDLLTRAYEFIKLRPIDSVLTSNLKVIRKELSDLGVSTDKIELITEMQSSYLDYLHAN